MNIQIFDTPQDTAQAISRQLIRQLQASQAPTFHLAISGGSTPNQLFRLWAEQYASAIPWHKIHLYWVDERCVPPTDSDSNFGAAKHLFLDKVRIPPTQIHRIIGEANPEHEASRYSELVCKKLPLADGFPQFNLIILGIGEDGHTSSVFPGQQKLLTTTRPYAPSINPTNNQARIALTGQPMLRAGMTLFHITGSNKADILAKIMENTTGNSNYPAAYIMQNADHPVCFADKAASSGIIPGS